MDNAQDRDGTTTAIITVTEPDGSITRVDNITAFSYSSDVQQIGDPFSVTVPDPRGIYRTKLKRGSRVEFALSSPSVNGGAATKKVTGIIVGREVSVTSSGTVVALTGADLGWHLTNNDGPLWFNLRGEHIGHLAQGCIHPDQVFDQTPDPKWGFGEVIFSKVSDTLAKQGVRLGKLGVQLEQQGAPLVPLMRIQIEPGQKLYDVLSMYARRFNVFVGVTAAGDLVLFAPNDDVEASYQFYCYDADDERASRNNIEDSGLRLTEDITEVYTTVQCVGDLPLPDLADQLKAQDDVNATKFHGEVTDNTALPFLRQCVFGDGEAMDSGQAQRRALWKMFMGLFNAHVITFTVRGHHQGGKWYEADTVASLDFPVIGIGPAPYYISAVRCDRDAGGDKTHITCHLPQLLAPFVAQLTR